jgi:hypothetical protein
MKSFAVALINHLHVMVDTNDIYHASRFIKAFRPGLAGDRDIGDDASEGHFGTGEIC